MRSCLEVLIAMNAVHEMDTMANLLRVVQRLPSYLQTRWRSQVQRLKREGRRPSFHDVVVFTEEAAEETDDAVFGTSRAAPKLSLIHI